MVNTPITLFDLLEVTHGGVDADLDAKIYGECDGVDSLLMGISARIVNHDLIINFAPIPAGHARPGK